MSGSDKDAQKSGVGGSERRLCAGRKLSHCLKMRPQAQPERRPATAPRSLDSWPGQCAGVEELAAAELTEGIGRDNCWHTEANSGSATRMSDRACDGRLRGAVIVAM